MKILNGIRIVLSTKKYLILLVGIIIIFSFVYAFAWNLILLPNFHVRTDLLVPLNILFLVVISILSGLATTLSVFNIKMKMPAHKRLGGYFAVIPAFFTSICPTCAPLLLSFTSTTFAIGLSIAEFGVIIRVITILILLTTILYLSSNICGCNSKVHK